MLGRSILVSDSGGAGGRKDGSSLDSEAGVRVAYDLFGSELYKVGFRALDDDGLAQEAVQETSSVMQLPPMRLQHFPFARQKLSQQSLLSVQDPPAGRHPGAVEVVLVEVLVVVVVV